MSTEDKETRQRWKEGQEVVKGVFLGSMGAANKEWLEKNGIQRILDVSSDIKVKHNNIEYMCLEGVTDDNCDIKKHFEACYEFIDRANVLVHCQAGISRSAAILCSYLIKKQRITAIVARDLVRKARKWVSPNVYFMQQLIAYHSELSI